MKHPDVYIWSLILSFPCLRRKFAGKPWPGDFDPDRLHDLTGSFSHGESLCILFVLNVWHPGDAKAKGWNFNVFDFLGTADAETKEAMMNWLMIPRWP